MADGTLLRKGSAEGESDISDLRLTTPDYAEISPLQLPIRGEKRIIPSMVTIAAKQDDIDEGIAAGGLDPNTVSNKVSVNSFLTSAALKPFVDFITVRIPHRGYVNGQPDQSQSAVYRFIINPSAVSIAHSTVDGQSFTRGGWQFGVWGDDIVQITLQGKTAGQYFALGTTDLFQNFTESYRNLKQLEMVFENNGYWFEGEVLGEGPLAADFTRRRIQKHQDVELTCGNYIWYGIFDSLTVSQTAENPFLSDFSLSFIAWKERFRSTSPYWDNIHNDIQRGHSFSQYQVQPTQNQNPTSIPGPSTSPDSTAPAVLAANSSEQFTTQDTSVQDQTPTFDIFNPNDPASLFSRPA